MTDLQKFWDLVVQVWTQGVFGIDVSKVIGAIAILAVAMMLRRVFTLIVVQSLQRLAARSDTDIDDAVIAALEKPLRFVPIVLGVYFAFEWLSIASSAEELTSKIMRSLIAFTIFWGLYSIVDPASSLFSKAGRMFTESMVEWLVKSVKFLFFFIGAATILEIWGIQVAPLIAGLGLFGVAVALGAQDLFKNLIAGISILSEQRFHKGDWILIEGVVEGTVEKIGFRSTRVRRFDKAPVYVPNTVLSDGVVTNFTKMTHRRIYWKIGVEYRTSADQLRTILAAIQDYLRTDPAFVDPPEVVQFVKVDSFGASSIDIMLYCFTRTTNWGEWLDIKEALAYRIKDIVEGAGTGFAFPSQSVYIESLPSGEVEAFTPPATVPAPPPAPD